MGQFGSSLFLGAAVSSGAKSLTHQGLWVLGSGNSCWSWSPLDLAGNQELQRSSGKGNQSGVTGSLLCSTLWIMEFLSYEWQLAKRNKLQKHWLSLPGSLPFPSLLEVMRMLAADFLMESLCSLTESQSQRASSLPSHSYLGCYLYKVKQGDGRKGSELWLTRHM